MYNLVIGLDEDVCYLKRLRGMLLGVLAVPAACSHCLVCVGQRNGLYKKSVLWTHWHHAQMLS